MKKILLILTVIFLLITGFAGTVFAQDESDFNDFFNYEDMLLSYIQDGKEMLAENLGFLGAYASYSLQTGHYAPTDAIFINAGITTNLSFVALPKFVTDNLTVLKDAGIDTGLLNTGILPMGFLYAGVNLPMLPIKVYARGMFLPSSLITGFEDDLIVFGVGVGYTMGLPFMELTALGNYHFMKGIDMLAIHSYGVNGILAFDVPVVNMFLRPFVGIGWSMTTVNVGFNVLEIFGATELADVENTLSDEEVPQEDIDTFIEELEEEAYFNTTINYALNFPISVGVRVNVAILKIILEYTTSLNLNALGSTSDVMTIFPPGAISLSLGIGF
jgi:hypothetical protein